MMSDTGLISFSRENYELKDEVLKRAAKYKSPVVARVSRLYSWHSQPASIVLSNYDVSNILLLAPKMDKTFLQI